MSEAGRRDAPPLVSIVVPTRDRPELLTTTLRSIVRQQAVPIEVVVVDDASTDTGGVRAVVDRLADRRIRIVRQPVPEGVSAARNRGLEAATANWIAFCDDDDLWAPDKLARQVRAAEQTGRCWVYTGSVDINRANTVTKGSLPPAPDVVVRNLVRYNTIPVGCSSVLVARDALTRVGGFDVRLGPCADWDLWLRLLRVGPPACVPEALVAYRLHPANMSLSEERLIADFAVLRDRYPTVEEATFRRSLFWWSLRSRRRGSALSHWVKAARARDRSFPRRLLAADLGYLVRDSADELLSRGTGGWWTTRRAAAAAGSPSAADPYLDAARRWVAQCN
jgi:glycosyltransferase involved in cell wall biosynthesis